MHPGVPGTSPAQGPLTQQGRGAIAQGVFLVAGHAERRDGVEGLGQEGLQARGAGVGGVEEVVDLLTGGTQLGHWDREGGQGCPARSPVGTGTGHEGWRARGSAAGRKQEPARGKAGEANPGHW